MALRNAVVSKLISYFFNDVDVLGLIIHKVFYHEGLFSLFSENNNWFSFGYWKINLEFRLSE